VRRFAIVFGVAAFAFGATAAPAWAHVNIEPASAPKGSDAVIAFVVPNEKDPQTTTKVTVQFPTDHPIAGALTEAIPGWSVETTQFTVKTPIQTDAGPVTSAVKSVTWTATGSGIPVDDFQEFKVSVGLPNDADALSFPTTQTYSDGSTVDWIQVTPPGGPDADNPVPTLPLTNAGAGSGIATTATPAASTVKKSDVDRAQTIAIVGVIAGGLGLLAGVGGLTMRRRKTA